ncbi:MAG: trypsin-like peptidase domain-containing protein [Lachnospiraceae bacterium]|nr:trypsin-like peptidase domain-containing protein [Lachnospiraceae bacterium]
MDFNHTNQQNEYGMDTTNGVFSGVSNTTPYAENRVDRSYIPQEPKKKEKKPGNGSGFLKKAIAVIVLGIFFGISAGVSFYFVNLATGMNQKTETVIQQEPEGTNNAQASGETTSPSGISTTNTEINTTVVTDVTDVVEEVMPSVVSITNTYTSTQSIFGQKFSSESEASGSGIIVNENDTELLIVTNHHVVSDADSLKVQFIDGEIADAQIKGTDSNMDLAVIAVKLEELSDSTKNAISIATLGDSDSLKVGEPAIAIGNALGYGQSVTTGVISALDRQIEMSEDGSTTGNLIQTDAAINPGNSGGALLNIKGEVIGINSNKIGGSAIEGMGYAIPISSAEPIIGELMTKETKSKVDENKKGFLGITGINVTSDVAKMYGMPEGVYITQVYDNTAASAAGLLKGDIITAFDGSTVGSMEDLQEYLQYYEAGETVNIKIQRTQGGDYEEVTVPVTLGSQSQINNNR